MNSFGFYDVYYSKKRNESYIVQKGDSLYKIAQKYGVTVEELKKPRQHPTEKMVEAIKEALKHFEII